MFSEGENLYTTIQMGHFQNEITIKDDVVNSDDILSQIDEVMQFIKKHISKELIITDTQIENIQRWQYPLDAIREIVLNMIIHRDYTSSFNSIIKIFPNHIQFYNPGNLPDAISIDQLLTNDYISKPRNRQIAKTIKEMGWIERYGTGIKRIRRMFVEYGLSEPVFKEEIDGMVVTVFGLSFDENTQKFLDKEKDLGGQTGGQTFSDMSERIINILLKNPKTSRNEISNILNISTSAVQKHIEKLKKSGVIRRKGGDFGGYWQITEKQ